MRQDTGLNLSGVMEQVRATGLLSSLCTITESPEIFDDGGAPVASADWIPIAGMIDIPCMAPPLMTSDRVTASEERTMSTVRGEDTRHVLLDGYYPDILELHRAVIDGVEFDIANVEHDSQKQMTRLAARRITI